MFLQLQSQKFHNRPTLDVNHCFCNCKVKNLLSKTRLFITKYKFHRFGNSSYFIIYQRHNFLPILGLILLKLKHASIRPVYFRDLCTRCLQSTTTKILPYHTSTQVCKFVKHHDIKIHKGWTTNNIFAIRGKKPFLYFNCVRANKTHNPCHKAYANK